MSGVAGAVVETIMSLTQQVHLEKATGEADENDLADNENPGNGCEEGEVPGAFALTVLLFNLREESIDVSDVKAALILGGGDD